MSAAAQFAGRLGAAARRPASWVQLFKFGLVGGSGYLINLAVFAVLDGSAGMNHVIAAICAFVVAVTNNFLWNRYWTFGPGEGPAHFQAARFFAVSLASLGLNLAILQLLVGQHLTGELTAQAIAVAAAMPFNFLGNKLWAFA
jgi:dolichol-phosphate mannosyltransferase